MARKKRAPERHVWAMLTERGEVLEVKPTRASARRWARVDLVDIPTLESVRIARYVLDEGSVEEIRR